MLHTIDTGDQGSDDINLINPVTVLNKSLNSQSKQSLASLIRSFYCSDLKLF